ncbi:hypothetical protein MtrunA17_Chr2g0287851 [Medicago truncatula]|uniref:Uncharacterized protein n=1 Tax=Medicago truncatula TaxID=3880 RepID=A0A396JBC5_MEDTR|nr:hypothetical protein MtrunA17_Chr2g0287851 [Medicago truncatula]
MVLRLKVKLSCREKLRDDHCSWMLLMFWLSIFHFSTQTQGGRSSVNLSNTMG